MVACDYRWRSEAAKLASTSTNSWSFRRRALPDGNWTTRGYTNSRIANSRTGHLADWLTRGLDNSRTSQLADWTNRGLDSSRSRRCAKRTKTKHAMSPVASASCPVREVAIRELPSNLPDNLLRCSFNSSGCSDFQVPAPAVHASVYTDWHPAYLADELHLVAYSEARGRWLGGLII